MDETVTFSDITIHSLQYGDANMGCSVGEQMTVKDCLYALMLQSANEVAHSMVNTLQDLLRSLLK